MQETHNVGLEIPRLAPADVAPKLRAKPVDPKAPRGRSPLTGAPVPMGRQKGTPNRVTQTLREAVELAARDCHPKGLAGWLVERAQGGVQDRQIFAGLVGKVIPIQVNQAVSGGVSISLNWLGSRNIGTVAAHPRVIDAHTVELIEHSPSTHWTTNGTPEGQGASASEALPIRQAADPPPPCDPDDGGVAETRVPPSSSAL